MARQRRRAGPVDRRRARLRPPPHHDQSGVRGQHDCLAGGVIDPGETPRQTATRELDEELGISGCELEFLASAAWDGQWAGRPMRCHLFAYGIRHDGPFRHQPEEIAEGWWWTDAELASHLADPAWPFVPDTRELVDRLLR